MVDLSDLYIQTPLIFSDPLSRMTGSEIYLKLEALQPSGSFKNRGIGRFINEYVRQGRKDFICSSGGNAGLAAAYAARKLGVSLTVVVPECTSLMMIEKIAAEKASVIKTGIDWQEADNHARFLCQEKNACYVPPFDHPYIWSGHATLIHEAAKEGLLPDAVVVAVGGGGLFCGVVEGMQAVGWKDVPVFAVETEGAASFHAAIKSGKVVELDKVETIAKSLAARAVAEQALTWTKTHPVISKLVTDAAAAGACLRFAEDHRLLVEPACGAALSLCYDRDKDLTGQGKVLVVVCGGSAVSPEMMLKWQQVAVS